MGYSIEKSLRIYDDKEGVYVEIRNHPDFPEGALLLHTNDIKSNEDFYGKIFLSLSKDHALALSRALATMASEIV